MPRGNAKYTYKLDICVGLALISREVMADSYEVKDGTYYEFRFMNDKQIVGSYPVGLTIIRDIYENPKYDPREEDALAEEHRRQIRAMMGQVRR